MASLTVEGKNPFFSPSSYVSREFLLIAVSSWRYMPRYGFPENRASYLDMTEAFQPLCYVQMQPFAESAFVALTNSQSLKSLAHGNW